MIECDEEKMNNKTINKYRIWYVLLSLFFVVSIIYIINVVYNDYIKRQSIFVKSEKREDVLSEKQKTFVDIQNKLSDAKNSNLIFKSDNLNFAYIYEDVLDEDDRKYVNTNNPVPLTLKDNEKDLIECSVAYQVFEKLKYKLDIYIRDIQKLSSMKPKDFITMFNMPIDTILANYNPTVGSHRINDPDTYIIDSFSNVNINFYDIDGNEINDYKNLQDIMSLGSVYSYYNNIKDYKPYIDYCYNLFDKSYKYVATISEVYYCSGCMNTDKDVTYMPLSIDMIPGSLDEQKVDDKYEQKAGKLDKIDLSKIDINDYSYSNYVEDIINNGHNKLYSYCPGHIDLDVDIYCSCIDNENSLFDVDDYGNNENNFNEYWHGWDINMMSKANTLSNSDWGAIYGINVGKIEYLKPLPRELINYYMSTLSDDLSSDRKKIIETALTSVSKIPYYYGGKPNSKGLSNNHFNNLTKPDYNKRKLTGLDCSGWIKWVYWTALGRNIITGEGTGSLANTGSRITRDELKPGDIILRPGYDSHVMMFLSFEEDGKVKVIHENGTANNVSIAVYDAYYPYYRKILKN